MIDYAPLLWFTWTHITYRSYSRHPENNNIKYISALDSRLQGHLVVAWQTKLREEELVNRIPWDCSALDLFLPSLFWHHSAQLQGKISSPQTKGFHSHLFQYWFVLHLEIWESALQLLSLFHCYESQHSIRYICNTVLKKLQRWQLHIQMLVVKKRKGRRFIKPLIESQYTFEEPIEI